MHALSRTAGKSDDIAEHVRLGAQVSAARPRRAIVRRSLRPHAQLRDGQYYNPHSSLDSPAALPPRERQKFSQPRPLRRRTC